MKYRALHLFQLRLDIKKNGAGAFGKDVDTTTSVPQTDNGLQAIGIVSRVGRPNNVAQPTSLERASMPYTKGQRWATAQQVAMKIYLSPDPGAATITKPYRAVLWFSERLQWVYCDVYGLSYAVS